MNGSSFPRFVLFLLFFSFLRCDSLMILCSLAALKLEFIYSIYLFIFTYKWILAHVDVWQFAALPDDFDKFREVVDYIQMRPFPLGLTKIGTIIMIFLVEFIPGQVFLRLLPSTIECSYRRCRKGQIYCPMTKGRKGHIAFGWCGTLPLKLSIFMWYSTIVGSPKTPEVQLGKKNSLWRFRHRATVFLLLRSWMSKELPCAILATYEAQYYFDLGT